MRDRRRACRLRHPRAEPAWLAAYSWRFAVAIQKVWRGAHYHADVSGTEIAVLHL
ncbi:hypothetical protein DIPPA_26619 [Diplonema papillatum]|nr:hypothetical protein DIPPA_26619 [Diplonema papillatum]